MRIKKGFKLRTICGENIIVPEGIDNVNFRSIISLNESSAFLWESIIDKDFSKSTLIDLLTSEYEVDEATAKNDVDKLVAKMLSTGLIEE
jgi:hypothetical protein